MEAEGEPGALAEVEPDATSEGSEAIGDADGDSLWRAEPDELEDSPKSAQSQLQLTLDSFEGSFGRRPKPRPWSPKTSPGSTVTWFMGPSRRAPGDDPTPRRQAPSTPSSYAGDLDDLLEGSWASPAGGFPSPKRDPAKLRRSCSGTLPDFSLEGILARHRQARSRSAWDLWRPAEPNRGRASRGSRRSAQHETVWAKARNQRPPANLWHYAVPGPGAYCNKSKYLEGWGPRHDQFPANLRRTRCTVSDRDQARRFDDSGDSLHRRIHGATRLER